MTKAVPPFQPISSHIPDAVYKSFYAIVGAVAIRKLLDFGERWPKLRDADPGHLAIQLDAMEPYNQWLNTTVDDPNKITFADCCEALGDIDPDRAIEKLYSELPREAVAALNDPEAARRAVLRARELKSIHKPEAK